MHVARIFLERRCAILRQEKLGRSIIKLDLELSVLSLQLWEKLTHFLTDTLFDIGSLNMA